MAQTTQIVPNWSFPYVETHINDYTQIPNRTSENTVDNSVKLAFAVYAGKGIDNTWVRKTTKDSAINTFGDSNFKKYGQPLMEALNVLDRNNSQVWMMRVMPENATYANAVVSAYYKADTAEEVTDAHNRKFRIKLTSKTFEDISNKADLAAKLNEFDGETIKVNGETIYKDGEGFIQKPVMAVNYAGRGVCGNNFSMRMTKATTYEKEFGIKMYNFEIVSSENSITKDANYVGALVSSAKYGSETTTLIDDVLSDVEAGIAPVDIKVDEENVISIYEEYVKFITKLHDDLMDEYDTKLDEYSVPEDQLNGTALVAEENRAKVAELRKISELIDDTDKTNIPDQDEFDIIFGKKVYVNNVIPCLQMLETLDDTVDTEADDYDAKDYTASNVVDFTSAKGLILENGTDGNFAKPRTVMKNGVQVQLTFEDELKECLINAYNGTYDKRILAPKRTGVTAFFDANYPFEVKKAIVDLAASRYDCRVYLDAGIINSLSTSRIEELTLRYSIFNTDMVSVDIHNYWTREYSTNKKVNVTIDYFLAAKYVDHLTNYGYHIPFCKEYCQLSGHVRDSLTPVIEECDMDIKELLVTNRFNYFECKSENVFQRSTQSTTQKANTDLVEENNSTILYTIKRKIEADVEAELYNFADESVRNSFIEVERAKYASLEGNIVQSFNISFATTEFEFTHSILHCYLAIVFRGLTKQAIVEIDLNKRTYNYTNSDSAQA